MVNSRYPVRGRVSSTWTHNHIVRASFCSRNFYSRKCDKVNLREPVLGRESLHATTVKVRISQRRVLYECFSVNRSSAGNFTPKVRNSRVEIIPCTGVLAISIIFTYLLPPSSGSLFLGLGRKNSLYGGYRTCIICIYILKGRKLVLNERVII